MRRLPIEQQVCTLEQAKELAELLGEDHAPKSLWVWVKPRNGRNYRLMLSDDFDNNYSDFYEDEYYRAYTGDELAAFLKGRTMWHPCWCPAATKARDLIKALKEGRITKKEVHY